MTVKDETKEETDKNFLLVFLTTGDEITDLKTHVEHFSFMDYHGN